MISVFPDTLMIIVSARHLSGEAPRERVFSLWEQSGALSFCGDMRSKPQAARASAVGG